VFAQVFDTVLELALLGLFAGVSGYAVHLVLTTVRGQPGTPAPREEAPGRD
jgi:hypothetical protein